MPGSEPSALPDNLPSAAALALLSPAGRYDALGTSRRGLGAPEVARRLARFGPNEPASPPRSHRVLALLGNFTHTLALLLWFAAGLALAAGVRELAAAIVAVVLVNGFFAALQEFRAEHVVESLMRRVAVSASVRRDDAIRVVTSPEVVPGDLVILAAGDVCPADVVLVEAEQLQVDVSMITGESVPLAREASAVPAVAPGTGIADLPMCVPAGAAIVVGSAEGIAFATGPASTLGEVVRLVGAARQGGSVLERQVADLSRITAILAVLAGAITLALTAATARLDIVTALTFSTGVIVALVPEGLLPTLTVSLAIGARRMAERGAAIRRLSAVESVGSVTVICTDKTGTLTRNELTVVGFDGAEGVGDDVAARVAALCNDAVTIDGDFDGDPLDTALLHWIAAQGGSVEALRACERLETEPFHAARRYMRVRCVVDGAAIDYVKGAPEAIEALTAPLSPALRDALLAATARGERVLAFAAGEPGSLRTVGLVRFQDPPRPEAAEAITACHRAGIRVIMLTGDHEGTARAIARSIGLGADTTTLDGAAVDGLSDQQILARLSGDGIVARVNPRQKLRIATLLRHAGEVVVVTGDGVNDAPALRAADVGIAMGRRGTEVAKQAADIILADDNFATIVAAIEEGRSIRANIRRFASYVFTSNIAELVPFLLLIFIGIPLPLTIMQVLAIDLGTDLLPALALGAEPPSGRTMATAPELPSRPLLTRDLALLTFGFFGVLEAALGLAGFFGYYAWTGWRPFEALSTNAAILGAARSATFLGVVGGQIGCLVAERDGRLRARLSLGSNRWIVLGLVVELAIAVALVYVPGLNGLFSMSPLPPAWLALLPGAAAIFIGTDQLRRGALAVARGRRTPAVC